MSLVFTGCDRCFPGNYWEPPSMCGACEALLEERITLDEKERQAVHATQGCFNDVPGAVLCCVCGGDLPDNAPS